MSEIFPKKAIYLDEAKYHCQQSLEIRMNLSGENDPNTIWSQYILGIIAKVFHSKQ